MESNSFWKLQEEKYAFLPKKDWNRVPHTFRDVLKNLQLSNWDNLDDVRGWDDITRSHLLEVTVRLSGLEQVKKILPHSNPTLRMNAVLSAAVEANKIEIVEHILPMLDFTNDKGLPLATAVICQNATATDLLLPYYTPDSQCIALRCAILNDDIPTVRKISQQLSQRNFLKACSGLTDRQGHSLDCISENMVHYLINHLDNLHAVHAFEIFRKHQKSYFHVQDKPIYKKTLCVLLDKLAHITDSHLISGIERCFYKSALRFNWGGLHERDLPIVFMAHLPIERLLKMRQTCVDRQAHIWFWRNPLVNTLVTSRESPHQKSVLSEAMRVAHDDAQTSSFRPETVIPVQRKRKM